MKKSILIILMTFLLFSQTKAQELNFGGDILNRYVWRGLDLGGKSPSIQPWMKLNMGGTDHSFTVGAWGAFSLAGTANEETDLYLSYTYKGTFTIAVTDYFFPGLNTGTKDNYFEWGDTKTGHILEGSLTFHGTERIPFTLLIAMNFYGNDARRNNGKIFKSKYIEIGYNARIKDIDLNVFLGVTPDKANINEGETPFYLNEKPGVINLGLKVSKSIQITENFSVPVQCSLISNPVNNKIFMVFGFSL